MQAKSPDIAAVTDNMTSSMTGRTMSMIFVSSASDQL